MHAQRTEGEVRVSRHVARCESTDTSELLSALTCRAVPSCVHRHRSGSPLERHPTRRLIVEPTLHAALSRCTAEPGLDRVRRVVLPAALTRVVAAAAFLAVVVDRTHTRRLAARRRMSASSSRKGWKSSRRSPPRSLDQRVHQRTASALLAVVVECTHERRLGPRSRIKTSSAHANAGSQAEALAAALSRSMVRPRCASSDPAFFTGVPSSRTHCGWRRWGCLTPLASCCSSSRQGSVHYTWKTWKTWKTLKTFLVTNERRLWSFVWAPVGTRKKTCSQQKR